MGLPLSIEGPALIYYGDGGLPGYPILTTAK